ncbi:hypothetical protein AAMO2058_000429100 [Amorphochlora amoebiformis]
MGMLTAGEACHLAVGCTVCLVQLGFAVKWVWENIQWRSHPAISLRGPVYVLVTQTGILQAIPIIVFAWAIYGYQNDNGMCAAYMIYIQFCLSWGASATIYRIAQISYKLSRLFQARENAVILHAFDKRSRSRFHTKFTTPKNSELVSSDQVHVVAADTVMWMLHEKIHLWAISFFIINFFGVFWLSDVPIRLMREGNLSFSECQSPAHAMTLIVWYIFAIPYAIWLKMCNFNDRFNIRGEIYVLTALATIAGLAYVLVALLGYCAYGALFGCPLGRSLSDLHWTAFLIEISSLLNIGYACSGSYLPLIIAKRESEEINKKQQNRYPALYDVLVYRPTLIRFYEHVYSEWSPENLLFYLSATSFEIDWTERAYKEEIALKDVRLEAFAIFSMFLSLEAEKPVNLSSLTTHNIHQHFSSKHYEKLYQETTKPNIKAYLEERVLQPEIIDRKNSTSPPSHRPKSTLSSNPLFSGTDRLFMEQKGEDLEGGSLKRSPQGKRESMEGFKSPQGKRESMEGFKCFETKRDSMSNKSQSSMRRSSVTTSTQPSVLHARHSNLGVPMNRVGPSRTSTPTASGRHSSYPTPTFTPKDSGDNLRSLKIKAGSPVGNRIETMLSLDAGNEKSPKASSVFLMKPRRSSAELDFKIKGKGDRKEFEQVLRVFTKARAEVLELMQGDSYM